MPACLWVVGLRMVQVMREERWGFGYNAATNKFEDLAEAGTITAFGMSQEKAIRAITLPIVGHNHLWAWGPTKLTFSHFELSDELAARTLTTRGS